MRRFALLALSVGLVFPSTLRSQTRSEMATVPLFTWNDAFLAGGFIAGTLALRPVDEYFARRLQNKYTQQNRFLQDVASVVRTIAEPGAMVIGGGLYVAGRLSKQRDMADLGLHGTEAVAVGSAVAWVLKDSFGRARPFVHPPTDSTGYNPNDWQFGRGFRSGDSYRSFPSGHSVAAFAAAAAVVNETSRWWPDWKWVIGPAMYGGAGLVGVSRMYNNRHHRSHPGNKFDRWLLGTSITPAGGGAGGYSLSWLIAPAPR
jgi:hypothetical protein